MTKINFNEKEPPYMLAKRQNNSKRSYLLVNPLQGKHIPAPPDKCLALFMKLGNLVLRSCKDEKVLVIGFAETATAIGAAVAKTLGANCLYIHTTRENLPEQYKLLDFNEEHSHAVGQMLYCKDRSVIFEKIDRIVFVEDEITTGKTILNFINAMSAQKLINKNIKISATSIINAMPESSIDEFHKRQIELIYLNKIDNTSFEQDILKYDMPFYEDKTVTKGQADISTFNIGGLLNPRLGVCAAEYESAYQNLSLQIFKTLDNAVTNKKVLILGTEEFMYPAICLGRTMQEYHKSEVYVHATTRSPILPIKKTGYPLQSRYGLKSVYDSDRQTYIYNLDKYDAVVIVTDSQENSGEGVDELCNCLIDAGNEKIMIFKWVE